MTEAVDQRKAMRLVLRARRAALSPSDQDAAAMAVIARLARIAVVREATLVAGYRAVRGEVNIDGAMALMAVDNTVVTVPRVVGEYLEFLPWVMDGVNFEGSFGIPEPADGEPRPLLNHDVVLAPLVAFDDRGHRLGQGGGFYDRALAARSGPKPVVIGIAHSFQQVEAVPTESWDIPLDAVVTEEAIIEFTPGCLEPMV